MEQKVQYNWKPNLCKVCRKYCHNDQVCRARKQQQLAGTKITEDTSKNGDIEAEQMVKENDKEVVAEDRQIIVKNNATG